MSRSIDLTPGKVAGAALVLLLLLGGAAGAGIAVSRALDVHSDDDHDRDHDAHGKTEKGEHHEDRVELSPEALKNAGIEILVAAPGKVAVMLALPGEVALNADTTAHVSPRVSGTVSSVKKQLGDSVRKGDILAMLESRDLADLQREFLATRERLALADANATRQKRLWDEKISAEKDFLAANQARAEAQIEHQSAAQKLAAAGGGAGTSGAAYSLVAPLDGTIIEKHITVGEVLGIDTRAFTIADLSSLWVNVAIYARDLAKVRVGQTALVRAEGIAEARRGTMTYIPQVVGEDTRSANGRVILDKPGPEWRPGLFVTAGVTIDEVEARVAIVDEAVQTLEGRPVVFVVVDNAFEARAVRVGRKGDGGAPDGAHVVEILEGLSPGDRYVGKNSFILKAELGKSEAGHEH